MPSDRRLFIKQIGFSTLGIGILSSLPQQVFSLPPAATALPRSTPEQQGVSSGALQAFLEAIEKSKIEFHSVMVLRHGKVIAEGWWDPYSSAQKHTLYSLSKSFTSTAIGLAINEKHFTLETPVVSFFTEELPAEVSDNLKAMKVKHLLNMATGHAKDTMAAVRGGGANWAKEFLSIPVEFEPGTHFVYNTGATYMLSAILQKKTGKNLLEYLTPRLFTPLGISDPDWEKDPRGINTGGYGLRIKTEDIAKFGQLYLQKGLWNGRPLIPAEWIADATTSHIDSSPAVVKRPKEEDDWSQGYGYQFWRCRHNAYRGDGAFGQFCIVLPDLDAVVAITGESFDLQASMNLVWAHVLPAMSESALPVNSNAHNFLVEKSKKLVLTPPQLNADSPIKPGITGKTFRLDSNEFSLKSLSLTLFDDYCLLRLTGDKSEQQVVAYANKWYHTESFKTQAVFPMTGRPEVATPLASSITWKDNNTLIMTLRYTATAHSDTITFSFQGNQVTVSLLNSVSKGNPDNAEKRKPLSGTMQS